MEAEEEAAEQDSRLSAAVVRVGESGEDAGDDRERRQQAAEVGAEGAGDAGQRQHQDQRRQAAEQRQRLQPLRARAKRLEAELERLAARKTELQNRLADPTLYQDPRKDELKALLMEQADADQALAEVEEAWLGISEELEAAASAS